MANRRILWIDDEVDSFGSIIKSLERDYEVLTATNGDEGLDIFSSSRIDAVILDEQMPGMSGIMVLAELKSRKPSVPVVMLTKSEEDATADNALGYGADDFITKPAKTIGIKTKLKLLLDLKEIKQAKMREECNAFFAKAVNDIGSCDSFDDWAQLYRRIVVKEVETEDAQDISEMHAQLRREANSSFAKFVIANYEGWFAAGGQSGSSPAVFSHQVLSKAVKPLLAAGEKVALVVIDNFRLDQWTLFEKQLAADFDIKTELYCSILPSATQFSRNAIFSGLLPRQIKEISPDLWVDKADNEEGLNNSERELLSQYFLRGRLAKKCSYYKVCSNASGEDYIRKFGGYKDNDLNAVVFSFVDSLSHTSSTTNVNRELLCTDAGYRSVTLSWLKHGVLRPVLDKFAANGFKIILTTDHGTIRVSSPIDITGTADINPNMRFKVDKNMILKKKADAKKVLEVNTPSRVGLPTCYLSDRFVFATNDDFFVYPNDRNEFVDRFKGSFQHGGISMEEMILPLATLTKKR